jgi:lipopolysaccharide heptosyltransferase III
VRILIFHTGSLGDTLVAVPSIWSLRENYPDARIDLLSDRPSKNQIVQAREILDGSGLINNFLNYSPSDYINIFKVLIKIRFRSYDKLVYLIRTRNSISRAKRDMRIFRCAGIRNFIGVEGFHDHPCFRSRPLTRSPNVAEELLNRLRVSGLSVPDLKNARFDIGINSSERERTNQILSKLPSDGCRRWVAMGISSKMPCKIWPFQRYQEVLENLIKEYDIWPIFFGGPEDEKDARKMVSNLGRGQVLAGKLNIREATVAMERCWFYLGNDCGIMHLAVSAGLKSVALFSAREAPGVWFPHGKGHQILRETVSCEGCMLEVCREQKMKCLLSISSDQVIKACHKIISNQH